MKIRERGYEKWEEAVNSKEFKDDLERICK